MYTRELEPCIAAELAVPTSLAALAFPLHPQPGVPEPAVPKKIPAKPNLPGPAVPKKIPAKVKAGSSFSSTSWTSR